MTQDLATMADKGRQPCSGIAFTLPISCQICLGKVKHPVVCPNQHVFCSPCIDVWLQHNQQCPSCRTPITEENPCKKILGGLNHTEDGTTDSFSKNKDLRRSRVELLFKDYEDELERLQTELETVQHENHILHEQVNIENNRKPMTEDSDKTKSAADVNMLMMLTKKLQDATGLYETLKKDMGKLKMENTNLKDENINLGRENQRLRLEFATRSPRKFGRFTVATLETKLDQYEKEMKQLQKALERSDSYIEDIEKELDGYRKKLQRENTCVRCKAVLYVQTMQDQEQAWEEKSKDTNTNNMDVTGDYKKLGLTEKEDLAKIMPPPKNENAPSKSVAGSREHSTGKIPCASSSLGKPEWRVLREESQEKSCEQSGLNRLHEDKDWRVNNMKSAEKTRESAKLNEKISRKLSVRENASKSSPTKSPSRVASFYGKRTTKGNKKGMLVEDHIKGGKFESTTSKDVETSFELEVPSPPTPVTSSLKSIRRLSLDSDKDTTVFDDTHELTVNDSQVSASSTESCKKRLKFENNMSDLSILSAMNSPGKQGRSKQVTFNDNVAVKSMSRNNDKMDDSLLDVTLPSDSETELLNDMKNTRSKQNINYDDDDDDPDMSMSSDIMDCMKLFDGAEKRLGQRRTEPMAGSSRSEHQDVDAPHTYTSSAPQIVRSSLQPSASGFAGLSSAISHGAGVNPSEMSHLDFLHHPGPVRYARSTGSDFVTSSTLNSHVTVASSAATYGSYVTSSLGANVSSTGGESHPFQEPNSMNLTGSTSQRVSSSNNILGQSYRPRPDSTSTLQGMLQRVASLETDGRRSASAPHSSIPDWKATSYGPMASIIETNASSQRQPSLGRSQSQGSAVTSLPVKSLSIPGGAGLPGGLATVPGHSGGLPHLSIPGPTSWSAVSQSAIQGHGVGLSQSSIPGFGAGLSQSSIPGCGAGLSQSAIQGLGAGLSQSSMPGLGAGLSQSSIPGCGAGLSQSSIPGSFARVPGVPGLSQPVTLASDFTFGNRGSTFMPNIGGGFTQ